MSYTQDEKISGLTSLTPTIDDVVVSMDTSDSGIAKKSTLQSIRDLFKTYFDTVYQAILVSGTNIKTINSNSLLGSGNITLTESDGDKGDITIASGVWTIDNDVVTNAKMANMATATFKGRTTAGTGDPEDLTATQATAILNEATTSLKGLMSSTDKTKLDNAEIWTLVHSATLSSIGTTPYDTGTLTSYDRYKIYIDITGTATYEPAIQFNSDTGANYITTYLSNTGVATSGSLTGAYLGQAGATSSYRMSGEIYVGGTGGSIRQYTAQLSATGGFRMLDGYWNSGSNITSFQFYRYGGTNTFSGTLRIYGKNN